jgi:hypothetical protein
VLQNLFWHNLADKVIERCGTDHLEHRCQVILVRTNMAGVKFATVGKLCGGHQIHHDS